MMPVRLDRFLKVSGLVKRRTLAKQLCDAGNIKVNGKTAKASHSVREGDLLEIKIGLKVIEAKVLRIPGEREQKAKNCVEILSVRKLSIPEDLL